MGEFFEELSWRLVTAPPLLVFGVIGLFSLSGTLLFYLLTKGKPAIARSVGGGLMMFTGVIFVVLNLDEPGQAAIGFVLLLSSLIVLMVKKK